MRVKQWTMAITNYGSGPEIAPTIRENGKYVLASDFDAVTSIQQATIDRLQRELAELQTCPNCGLQYTGCAVEGNSEITPTNKPGSEP